ncbi:UNVERIFIED_CONTAM: 2S albumin [Sesamum angustifolium]|uniref:2S albumin n=1 Tax=Sesamum angustifolium TaxID=2727405 RepID=A0AAW2N6Q1_9LAMI
MSKKLALAALLLVAMVALASATTYTTTVTTTAIDDEANQQSQQCRRELQGRQFRSCQMYLSQGRSPYGGDDAVLEMSTGNQQSEQSLRECCQQLRNVDERCRCEAIRHAVRQQQQEGGSYQEGQSQQVYQRARDLPRRCNMRPQQCQFRVIFV